MNPTIINDVRIRNMIIVVLVVLGFFLLVESVAVLLRLNKDNDMPSSRVINVRGTGEAAGTPDVATFSFTVRESGKDVAVVQQTMTTKANKAIGYLKDKGIDEKDIKTESYYTNPTYQYTNGKQILTGYEVSESVSVKVRDITKAGDLLTGVTSLQIGEVGSFSFTFDDPDGLKGEAKKKAIENARADAKKIADALGVGLGDVVGFYEEYPYDGYGGPSEMSLSSAKAQDNLAPTLKPGETKVTSNVSISYELED